MLELTRGSGALTSAVSDVREYLVFKLAGELYGLELTQIREILSPPELTLVPRAPRDVMGVCSVRGMLVTVFDLRRRLDVEQGPRTRQSRVLLCEAHAEEKAGEIVGLFVDEVRNVVRLAPSEVEIAQSILGADFSDRVFGIGRPKLAAQGESIILLDQRRITR